MKGYNMNEIIKWSITAITIAMAAVIIVMLLLQTQRKIREDVAEEIYREQEVHKAIHDFYSVEADLKQHLRDDGFIQPKSGSEEHYQRWKAEREKREP